MKLILSVFIVLGFSTFGFADSEGVEISITPSTPIVIMSSTIVRTIDENGEETLVEIAAPWIDLGLKASNNTGKKLVIVNGSFLITDPITGTLYRQTVDNINWNKFIEYKGRLKLSMLPGVEDIGPYIEKDFLITVRFEGWFEVDGQPESNFFQELNFTATSHY